MAKQNKKEKYPAIIAMKGLTCTGKSTFARVVGRYVEAPVIDEDDVLSSMSKLHPFSRSHHDFSFEVLCRQALTLLQLKFKVIIVSQLSQRAHLDRLIQLSTSVGVRLIVVECKPKRKYLWRSWLEQRVSDDIFEDQHKRLTCDDVDLLIEGDAGSSDYDIGDVTSLEVDTTATIEAYHIQFAVEELLSSSGIRHEKLPQWIPDLLRKIDYHKDEVKEHPQVEEEIQIYTRCLFFQYANKWRSEGLTKSCGKCREPICGVIYNCNQFKVLLHKSCAESPGNVVIPPQDDPPFLRLNPQPEYSFPTIERCSPCAEANRQFSHRCDSCLFQSHLKCHSLPTVIHHDSHEHPLFFRIIDISGGNLFKFQCDACGDEGNYIFYFCDSCNFKCHVKCAFSPKTVKSIHHRHILTRRPSPEYDGTEELYCNACEKIRDPKHWIYYCMECGNFACHLNCETLIE